MNYTLTGTHLKVNSDLLQFGFLYCGTIIVIIVLIKVVKMIGNFYLFQNFFFW